MAWGVWIDQTDVSTLGFYVEQVPGWISGPERDFPIVTIPGRMGGVLAAEPTIGPRTLTLIGTIVSTSMTTRRSYEDQLQALAYRGLVTLTIDDDVTAPLRIDAVCKRVTLAPWVHFGGALVTKATFEFLCPDPTFYALQDSILAVGTTATPIPLGNAPSGGILRIAAPVWSANVTDPTITYSRVSRATVQALVFTGITLTAGTDYLELDLDRSTVVEVASGTSTNRIANLASGDFPALDPMDGDYINSAFPYLTLSATAGTPSGVLTYRKRYL